MSIKEGIMFIGYWVIGSRALLKPEPGLNRRRELRRTNFSEPVFSVWRDVSLWNKRGYHLTLFAALGLLAPAAGLRSVVPVLHSDFKAHIIHQTKVQTHSTDSMFSVKHLIFADVCRNCRVSADDPPLRPFTCWQTMWSADGSRREILFLHLTVGVGVQNSIICVITAVITEQ